MRALKPLNLKPLNPTTGAGGGPRAVRAPPPGGAEPRPELAGLPARAACLTAQALRRLQRAGAPGGGGGPY
eukprot:5676831-Pyramimonas_sp.AAC.1